MKQFVSKYSDLAEALGVHTHTINHWKRKHLDYPQPTADGRFDILAWREWALLKGFRSIVSADKGEDTPENEDETLRSKDDYNRALLREKVRRERIKADTESGLAVLVSDIEVPLGALLASIQNGIDSFPDRAAPMVQGFTDVPEISRILHGEMQATVGGISIFDFERALEVVRPELRDEVAKALREIGKITIEQLNNQQTT